MEFRILQWQSQGMRSGGAAYVHSLRRYCNLSSTDGYSEVPALDSTRRLACRYQSNSRRSTGSQSSPGVGFHLHQSISQALGAPGIFTPPTCPGDRAGASHRCGGSTLSGRRSTRSPRRGAHEPRPTTRRSGAVTDPERGEFHGFSRVEDITPGHSRPVTFLIHEEPKGPCSPDSNRTKWPVDSPAPQRRQVNSPSLETTSLSKET